MLLDREADRRSASAGTTRTSPALVCAACGHRITDDAYAIEMTGAHEHTFVNPGGFVYRIGCFHPAPGCAHIGHTDAAFSWFPGWTWQIAVCASCRAHVGWIYRNAGEQFHGLVLAALRRAFGYPRRHAHHLADARLAELDRQRGDRELGRRSRR